MRERGVIQVCMRRSGGIRLRSRARQRHRECKVKIEAAPSLAMLGIFARLRLVGAASANRNMDRFYCHGKAAPFISEIASCPPSPNKAPEPTPTSVMPRANETAPNEETDS